MTRGAKPKTYDPNLVEAVRSYYEIGHTQHEIAGKLGVTQKVIFNVMRRHGLKARVAAKRDQWGPNNHAWKAADATKYAFHRRLYSRFGKPSKCTVCGTTSSTNYDYANLTGKYEDMSDYAVMCRSCHWKYDQKILNIKHMRRDADDQAQSA